jgi:hypothetical protein
VIKWFKRYRIKGEKGLFDHSSSLITAHPKATPQYKLNRLKVLRASDGPLIA